jgi:hypothetical protein
MKFSIVVIPPAPNHKGYPLSRAKRETQVEGTLSEQERGKIKHAENSKHKQC